MKVLTTHEIDAVSGNGSLGAVAGAWVGGVIGVAIAGVAAGSTAGIGTLAGAGIITGAAAIGSQLGSALQDAINSGDSNKAV